MNTVAAAVSEQDVNEIFEVVRRERPREASERERVGWMNATFSDERGLFVVTLAEDRAGKRVIVSTGTGEVSELAALELDELTAFADEPAGLVVVGGVGHCGRQKVVHALLRASLRGRRLLGVSAERTRSVEHEPNVWQVDVGEYGRVRHVATFAEAIRLTKAIGADALAVAEIPDGETLEEALSAIEREGVLVIARVFGRTVGESIAALGRMVNDTDRVVDAFAAGVSLRSYFDFDGNRRFVAERVLPNHMMRGGLKKGETDIRSYFTQASYTLEDQLRSRVERTMLSRDAAHTLAAFPDDL
jgi:Tfp pilus assembly pilus retraction ATPase PilT